jgi:hydrogenase maturation factor HypE
MMKKLSIGKISSAIKELRNIGSKIGVGEEVLSKIETGFQALTEMKDRFIDVDVVERLADAIESLKTVVAKLKAGEVQPEDFDELTMVYDPLMQDLVSAVDEATEERLITPGFNDQVITRLERAFAMQQKEFDFNKLQRKVTLALISLETKVDKLLARIERNEQEPKPK